MNSINQLVELWEGKGRGDFSRNGYSERRSFVRLEYPATTRPYLRVDDQNMEVTNISENGLNFFKSANIEVGKHINGTVDLLNGKSLNIIGKLIWQSEGDGIGLIIDHIPRLILIEEIGYLLQTKDLDVDDWQKYQDIMAVTSLLTDEFIQVINHFRDVHAGTTWEQVETALNMACRIVEDREISPKEED